MPIIILMLVFHKVRFFNPHKRSNRKPYLQLNPKRFADDTSLLMIINDLNATAKQLCKDLDKIKEWAFQWKTCFNADSSK